jgi:hypothetical protein
MELPDGYKPEFPTVRDCEHGRQRGHCPECDLIECEARCAQLERDRERLREALRQIRDHCDVFSADGIYDIAHDALAQLPVAAVKPEEETE